MTANQALSEMPHKSTGNRLTLRCAVPEDFGCLVAFFARNLTENETDKSDMRVIEFHL